MVVAPEYAMSAPVDTFGSLSRLKYTSSYSLLLSRDPKALIDDGSSFSSNATFTMSGSNSERSITPSNLIVVSISSLKTEKCQMGN